MLHNLVKPGKIGNLTVKNRMKYAPTVNNFCDYKTCEVTEREIAYLRERALGGYGLVTSSGAHTHILGKGYIGQMGLDHDDFIPGVRKLAQAIQAEGSIAIGQVMHTGRYGHAHEYGINEAVMAGKKVPVMPVGPTAMPSPIKRYAPCREMSIEEIEEEVEAHAQAARRFKEAGWDGVETCGIAGYLISNFLCRWTNKRKDKYGGSLENRARFLLEILKRTKEVVGPDYPLLIRLNGTDQIEGGNTEEEQIEIAKMVEEIGVVLFSVTVGWHESTAASITSEKRPGEWLYLAENWKKAGIKTPICMAYRLNRPDVADKAIGDGIIDYWEGCRPGIADPYLPKKIMEGREEDVLICPADNTGCFYYIFVDELMGCMVNPRVGREWDPSYEIRPAEKKKKVLVVGGGPAGMEAARVAALRGHNVALYEKSKELGGQLRLGAKSPLLYDWPYLIEYYATQLKKAGVKVELGKEASAALIDKERPDVLILATGAKPVVPKIPGIDKKHVSNVFEVLEGKVTLGNKVVFLGGNEIAVQTAEFVASQGKEVTIIEKGKTVGYDINIFNILSHRRLLAQLKTNTLVNVKVEKITDDGVVITTLGGKEATIAADTIVNAEGMEADKTLSEALKATAAAEIYSIGDCAGFRKLYEAIHDGYKIGVKV
ncbi:MAG: FAD-dependent oxidoreductase [Pseudomonadota bacterium]